MANTKTVIPPKAPNLPIAPVEYNQQYIDQLNNVLRLYFNQIDNSSQAIFSGKLVLPSSSTGLTSGSLWYDPSDSNRVKYVP